MDRLNHGYGVFLTALALALIFGFSTAKKYGWKSEACYEDSPRAMSYVVVVTFGVLYSINLSFSIYLATRVIIQKRPKIETDSPDHNERSQTARWKLTRLGRLFSMFDNMANSPVDMAIKRNVLSGALIVSTDILVLIFVITLLPVVCGGGLWWPVACGG